jgi:hypothetical protein
MTRFEECRSRARPPLHVAVGRTPTDYNRVAACRDEEWRRDPPKVAK